MFRVVLALSWIAAILWLLSPPLAAQPGQGKLAKSDELWLREVEGYGLTLEAAKVNAVEYLREETAKYLRLKDAGALVWTPSAEFVRSQLLQGRGHAGPDKTVEPLGHVKTWIYDVRPLDFTKILVLEEFARRRIRAEGRIIQFSFVLGGAILLVGIGSGMLLVREWWKIRASKRLSLRARPLT